MGVCMAAHVRLRGSEGGGEREREIPILILISFVFRYGLFLYHRHTCSSVRIVQRQMQMSCIELKSIESAFYVVCVCHVEDDDMTCAYVFGRIPKKHIISNHSFDIVLCRHIRHV